MSKSFNIHLTLADTSRILRQIVEDFGHDYNPNQKDGEGCVYFKMVGSRMIAVCLVGQVYAYLGVLRFTASDGGTLDYPSGYGACAVGDNGIFGRLSAIGITFSESAQRLLDYAQRAQDGRGCNDDGSDMSPMGWGDAYNWAIAQVRKDVETAANAAADRARFDYLSDAGFSDDAVEPIVRGDEN